MSPIRLRCSSNRSPGNKGPARRSAGARPRSGGHRRRGEEHVAVAGIERRRVLGHVHEGIMRHARPVQHAPSTWYRRCRSRRSSSRRRQARDPRYGHNPGRSRRETRSGRHPPPSSPATTMSCRRNSTSTSLSTGSTTRCADRPETDQDGAHAMSSFCNRLSLS